MKETDFEMIIEKEKKDIEILEMIELYTYIQKKEYIVRIWTTGGWNLRCFSVFDIGSVEGNSLKRVLNKMFHLNIKLYVAMQITSTAK
ncbi:hypothetical protein FACS1894113_4020 [Alphaproteobacteria bacterium]|nr:hypothetical protein FACS1894113_4020 [Alphaproteobacteria bacterium]